LLGDGRVQVQMKRTRLAGDPAMLTRYFQIPEGELKRKAVTDPRAAVAGDVASLRAISALPGD
jgi:carbonic anhydrase